MKFNTDKPYKVIHSQKLAGHLMARGFVLVRTEPDRRGNGRNVFLFRKSDELERAITEYSSSRSQSEWSDVSQCKRPSTDGPERARSSTHANRSQD
ncbi:DUF5659 domain-containing protein [Brevibacillus borstelensis]|uniref:DUF5659 domain-containing protein n=1 Tax=Brevibacillus borstelensis TaxID=45462 RepID=UPI003D8163BF